jgi:hypothetical protein
MFRTNTENVLERGARANILLDDRGQLCVFRGM